MRPDVQLYTNSRGACARRCLREHEIRYELGIVPERDALALRIGTAFHLCRELRDAGIDPTDAVRALDLSPHEQETVLRLDLGYVWRWQADGFDVVATESAFDVPIINPETGAATPVWRAAGKRDRIVRLPDGRLALQEYKTTSDDLAPDSDYWARVRFDGQITLYVIAARAEGFDVQAIVYDVTRKPAIRPGTVPLVDESGAKIVHDANGDRVMTKDGKKWRETADTAAGYVLQTRPETPEEWGERLTNHIAANPDFYFRRVEIPRLARDIEAFQHELWQQQLSLRACQRSGHWFRNPEACVTPTRTCQYLHICGRDDLATNTPEGFRRLDDPHPELRSPEASPATNATPGASPVLQ